MFIPAPYVFFFLLQYIFNSVDYKKPFFTTYAKTGMFILYLSGFLFRRTWRQQCRWPKVCLHRLLYQQENLSIFSLFDLTFGNRYLMSYPHVATYLFNIHFDLLIFIVVHYRFTVLSMEVLSTW